jgi:hypothetical protein
VKKNGITESSQKTLWVNWMKAANPFEDKTSAVTDPRELAGFGTVLVEM